MKKRSCRRTPQEQDEHDKAVKLRKMTDHQLIELLRQAQSGKDVLKEL